MLARTLGLQLASGPNLLLAKSLTSPPAALPTEMAGALLSPPERLLARHRRPSLRGSSNRGGLP